VKFTGIFTASSKLEVQIALQASNEQYGTSKQSNAIPILGYYPTTKQKLC